MSIHATVFGACPACGRINNVAKNAQLNVKAPPRPGDLTICTGCERVLVFNADGSRRRATVDEESENAELIATALGALARIKAQRAKKIS